MTGAHPNPGAARPAGARIGDYEIVGRLGSGGMGEVFRARDLRLGREVALKILPDTYSSDRERTRRFEREARAISALSHPNIVTLYELGSHESTSYITMELVEGKTLRELLRAGPIPLRRLLDVACGVASGLARAHAGGIVHRDLKPENVMLSKDGFAKILDFGLAKWLPFEGEATGEETTLTATEPGLVLGTIGYMSPEQAMGKKVDYRSDQFSFGSILYEMATGKRAFQKETKPETLSAIIRDQPDAIAAVNPAAPPPLRWIVERCLSKDPADRYASTEDLARELAMVRDHLSETGSGVFEDLAPSAPRNRWLRVAAAILVPLVLLGLGAFAGSSFARTDHPRFRRLTFQNAAISRARFAPDGQMIVYSAQREGGSEELYSFRLDGPESRPLGLRNCELLAISEAGEMAILSNITLSVRPPHRDSTVRDPRLSYATLARVPLGGGAPREILDEVRWASWAPDGRKLAVVHYVNGGDQLEFPIGKVLYRSTNWLNNVRVSPRGDAVAFKDGARALMIDASGRTVPLADGVYELLWAPEGNEVWANRIRQGSTEVLALRPDKKERLLLAAPADLVLHDLTRDGKLLIGSVSEISEVFGIFPGDLRPRNISYFDRSNAADISGDGTAIVFNEVGAIAWSISQVYVRKIDGTPAVRLGEGLGMALSRDGKWVLAITNEATADKRLELLPTGPGETKVLSTGGIEPAGRGGFFPDGKRIFFMGSGIGHKRAYVMDLVGGSPRPVTPDGSRRALLSGDGRYLTARAADGDHYLYPTDAGPARRVAGIAAREEPIQWSADGRFLYVRGADEVSAGGSPNATKIYRLDPWSGRRDLWKEIQAPDASRGGGIGTILISGDGRSIVYTHHSYSSDLYLVEGLK